MQGKEEPAYLVLYRGVAACWRHVLRHREVGLRSERSGVGSVIGTRWDEDARRATGAQSLMSGNMRLGRVAVGFDAACDVGGAVCSVIPLSGLVWNSD